VHPIVRVGVFVDAILSQEFEIVPPSEDGYFLMGWDWNEIEIFYFID
jgi:hypothetical protein